MLVIKKHSKIIKIAGCLFVMAIAIFLLSNFVLAASPDLGLDYAAGTGLSNNQDIRITIAKIIRIALGFLGIIAIGLIIYAGWLWMTSAGNPEKIEQAKKILTNAVIGLIIIFSAFAIASFILNMLLNGAFGNGRNGPGNGPGSNYGLSALGNGIIESHYPARDQKEVPRNTSIIISFREPMLANTLCDAFDTTIGAKCNDGNKNINRNVVRIFKKSQEAICVAGDSPADDCTSLVDDVKVYSNDNKTFVFVPKNYLGSPSEYIDYTVYLGKGLRRQSGCETGALSKCDKAFPGFEEDYGWSFEVSNKIDLTPPQVMKNGVFPTPDNLRDAKDENTSTDASQARGTITVNSPRVYSGASASVSTANFDWSATVTVDKSCDRNGDFSVNVDSNNKSIIRLKDANKDANNILLGQGTVGGKTVSFDLCNLKLTLNSGNFVVNSLWTVTIQAMTAADTITVGNITYTAISGATSGTNFKVENNDNATAGNLRTAISNILSPNPDVSATVSEDVVTITAKFAGAAGNSINLSSSNDSRLKVAAMANGKDKVDDVVVNGKKDQPMNAVIQINFNEAIMPLTVSGKSDEVKDFIKVVNADLKAQAKDGKCAADADCQSFVCENKKCAGGEDYYLKGKFLVSNQYSTVEFLSDKECGYNNCGEKIYCLPANSHLRVELNAASLISCSTNDDCKANSPFNKCDINPPGRGYCWDGTNYFPQAAKAGPKIVDGIVDMAFNSLDGNRDGSAYGPDSSYNENSPLGICESGANINKACTEENKVADCGLKVKCLVKGDSYQWSFFISDKLDLTPPKIKTTTPAIDGTNVDLIKEITISFDKLMLSSRLTTGSLMIKNGEQEILHYLLNLRSFVDQPLGYWVTNLGLLRNGELDSTDAYINHSPFGISSTYKAQAGSGLKDIYQNCYLPCSSLSNPGDPSCCNGVAQDKETCP